ncbi:unnamed protein product [Linum trigynum]|uniref:Pentatricopeptide repeat-containing protein n=1 Tax=Linum trigynum TaxID=586398 RepID=A0AAV2CVG6_9ROSI
MSGPGCLPDIVTYSSLLDGLCRRGKIDDALALFQVIENRLKSDVVGYAILLDGLWKAGRGDEAREMFSKLSRDNCLQLNSRIYSIATNGLCRQGFVDEAYELFRKMEGDGCLPNSGCYNVIIHGFLRHKDPLEAIDLIHKMVSKGFSADTTTMTLLIELLPKNQLDHPIFQKLMSGPDIRSHNIGSGGLSAAATQGTC